MVGKTRASAPASAFPDHAADLVALALGELPDSSVMVFDLDLRYLLARGSALAVNDFTPADLEGRLAAEALDQARWEFYQPLYEAALRGESSSLDVASPDGQRSYNVRVSPVKGSDGEVLGGVAVASDITELRTSTQELAASERRFRMLAENSPDVIVLVDADDRVSWASPRIVSIFGWPLDQVLGHRASEFVHLEDVQRMADHVSAAHQVDARFFHYRFRKADGAYIAVESNSRPVFGPDGALEARVVRISQAPEEAVARGRLEDSEALLRVVLDHTSDAIMRFGPDLRVEYVNRRLVEFTGISLADWIGKTFAEAGFPEHLTLQWDEYSRRVFASGEPVLHEFELDLPGGHRWFETRVDPEFAAEGSVAHVITTSRDVTERRLAEAKVRASEGILNVVLEGSQDGTATFGPDLRIEYVNRRATELWGQPADFWIGRTMAELGFPESSVDFWHAHIREVLATAEPRTMQYEVDNTEGHRWYEASLAPQFAPDGSVAHVISTNRDITDRVLAEAALREAATHDSLTGLANRAALLDEINRALSASRRGARSTAVLMIDLDRFKNVNDSMGHGVGDALLEAAAERIVGAVRGGDLVGRTGGDEFVVVMRELDEPAEVVSTAWRLVEAFRAPFSINEGELYSTASIGVAVATASSQAADLLREADTAMYVAKEGGRDRVAAFNEDLRAVVTARLEIESDLRHALDRGELAVWFQPEVDLTTGSVIAAEALVRWHHPSGDLFTADRFVEVAEETGLILDIGDWVLREACAHAAAWPADAHGVAPTVRVNVSTMQLSEGGLLEALDAAMASSRLDPGRLCLEITETALLRESTVTRDNLEGIRDRGIRVAIDDFGTGYASLTYLHRYPIDLIKIDRSFVSDIMTNDHDYRLVGGLIALAMHLGLSVTAEGVEREEQAAALRGLGCPSAQGFLYSGAVSAPQLTEILGTVFPHP